jgi:hypothetical protein
MKLKHVLYFSILVASQSSLAVYPRREAEIPTNSIYKNYGDYLYDQSSLIEKPEYMAATEKEKEEMAVAEFNYRRRVSYGKEFGKVTGTLGLTFPAIYWILGHLSLQNGAAGVGGTLLVYQLFGNVISDITYFVQSRIENAKSIFFNVVWPSEKDLLEKYELEYVRKKQGIAKPLQELLEENFIQARLGMSQGGGMGMGLTRGEKGDGKSPVVFAKNVLSLPTQKIKIVYDPLLLDKYLGTYDPKVLRQLKRFAARHAAASTGKTVKKIVVYFQGPPGVGKTRAAENLGKAMNAPFKLLKLGGKTLADIEGDESKPGLLLEALMQARNEKGENSKGPFIFCDELDRAIGLSERDSMGGGRMGMGMAAMGRGGYGDASGGIEGFFLDLFEPGQTTFYSPYLRADVDVSDVIFGAAGNVDWEIYLKNRETKDRALADRFEFVRFEGYTPEFKLAVVESTIFDELLQVYKGSVAQPAKDKPASTDIAVNDTQMCGRPSSQPILKSDFSDVEMQSIRRMVLKDKEPGFREVIRKIQNRLDDKALCLYYCECRSEAEMEADDTPAIEAAKPAPELEAKCDGDGCNVENLSLEDELLKMMKAAAHEQKLSKTGNSSFSPVRAAPAARTAPAS